MGARIMLRVRLLHNGTRIIIALVLLLPGVLTAATGAHWRVVNQPTRLVNGTPVLFEVTTPTPVRALSGSWLGHEITFSFDATDKLSNHKSSIDKSSTHKLWFALAGVSLETKPGTYPLELHADISSDQSNGTSAEQTISFQRKIRIEQQRYPRVELKVPTRYTAPSPEDQREIEKGKEIKG